MNACDVLDVYPKRLNQKIAHAQEVFTPRTTRRSQAKELFVFDDYLGKPVLYETRRSAPKRLSKFSYSPERSVTAKVRNNNGAKHVPVSKKEILFDNENKNNCSQNNSIFCKKNLKELEVNFEGSCSHASNSPDKIHKSNPDTKLIAKMDNLNEKTYLKDDTRPVFVFGKIAIEYEDGDLSQTVNLIRHLKCFNNLHDLFLVPLLKLAGPDITKNLNQYNVKEFYKEELSVAYDNFMKYKMNPELFFDSNREKFERYVEEGVIVEIPLPPKPEVFPFQIMNRVKKRIAEENAIENESLRIVEESEKTMLAMRKIAIDYQQLMNPFAQVNPFSFPNFFAPLNSFNIFNFPTVSPFVFPHLDPRNCFS